MEKMEDEKNKGGPRCLSYEGEGEAVGYMNLKLKPHSEVRKNLNPNLTSVRGKVIFIPKLKVPTSNFGTIFSVSQGVGYINFGLPFQEHHIRTGCGIMSVIVYGDPDKPALITYPNLALNFFPLKLPQEFLKLGATAICAEDPVPSPEDLADQIIEVLKYFGLGAVMCMRVTVGVYILTLFAVMANLIYFYGMCGLLKECLLQRYFNKEVRGNDEVAESEIVQACRKLNLNGSGAGVLAPNSAFFGSSLKKVIASRVPNTKIPYEYISTGLRQ
ncbi:hypothetical protein JHK87_027740 [Glycine soja]|nr:hypothetical protein JHK87_027740 [Glycine soja]